MLMLGLQLCGQARQSAQNVFNFSKSELTESSVIDSVTSM